ncbi:MAG TPA: PAS domain-containing protein [Gemmatimonadales bacterium]|nr:PAS domain-containing protein [Gemmatimonadales bacterium]
MSDPAPDHDERLRGLWAGAGEMGTRMRALDWSRPSLGAPADRPQGLRSAISICLHSRFPIAIYWGADLALLYDDAWSPILGEKHPWALGRPGREVWPEIWDRIAPLFERVTRGGEGVWQEDELLPMRRHGYTEECCFNFTFSPILDESGRVGGVFNAVVETTYRVIGERWTRVLRLLAERTAGGRSMAEVCDAATATLREAGADLPFALLYLLAEDGGEARRAAADWPLARVAGRPACGLGMSAAPPGAGRRAPAGS